MAAGNFTLFNNAKLLLLNGTVNMAGTPIAAALLSASYTPSAAHSTWADVTSTEITDSDYAEKALTGQSVTGTSGTVTVDSDDISFGTAVTLTAKYLVLVAGTAGSLATTDKLIGYVDLNSGGGTVSSTAGTFKAGTPSGLFTAA